jgi:hypothetical protein
MEKVNAKMFVTKVYIAKDVNKNVNKSRLRRNEWTRQSEDRVSWELSKDWTDILEKFVKASFLNNNFNKDDWMKDIISIFEGYKNALKSEKIYQKQKKLYMNTWVTTINTLTNIHKTKDYRTKHKNMSKCLGTINILDITSVYHKNH